MRPRGGGAFGNGVERGRKDVRTSAVLGTLSQNTSILRSPRDVCSVTDIAPVNGAEAEFGGSWKWC